MARRLRGLVVALVTSAVLAAPAAAYTGRAGQEPDSVPILIDMLFLRPIGLVVMGAGLAAFALTAPLVLVTRPSDIGKPFATLVVTPAQFTFVDALGHHPDRYDAGFGVIE